jgi:peptide methionine sulfoxide reductase MsrA
MIRQTHCILMEITNNMENIYLAGGCFWGMEELFRGLDGVTDTETGYSGGENESPTYAHRPGLRQFFQQRT